MPIIAFDRICEEFQRLRASGAKGATIAGQLAFSVSPSEGTQAVAALAVTDADRKG